MSKMNDYNIDLWNAAFEIKSLAVKWGIDVTSLYRDMEHIIISDELKD